MWGILQLIWNITSVSWRHFCRKLKKKRCTKHANFYNLAEHFQNFRSHWTMNISLNCCNRKLRLPLIYTLPNVWLFCWNHHNTQAWEIFTVNNNPEGKFIGFYILFSCYLLYSFLHWYDEFQIFKFYTKYSVEKILALLKLKIMKNFFLCQIFLS